MSDQPNLVTTIHKVPDTEYELVVNATPEGQIVDVTMDQFSSENGGVDPIREGIIPRPLELEDWGADSLRSLVGTLMDVLERELPPRLPDGWSWVVDNDFDGCVEADRPWSGIWPNNRLWVRTYDRAWGHGDAGTDGYIEDLDPGASKQEVIVQLIMAAEAWAVNMEEAVRNGLETCRDGRESSDAE